MKAQDCNIAVGEGVVTVKRRGTRGTTVASILGTVEADGVEVLCLDRLVHGIHESDLDGWQVAGAVTTLLSRPIGPRQPMG
ncbi:hypothetical protein [Cupriavidus pinatubonensis]|uniref:Uncharacterized protein n=1 Tax=Cupriavidus pinatubonensis TaxID=248026 RepID=A0ABN7XWY7_9BURK|nr:hypothetical protein [Cupriavidus pinatubonensis]CAG9165619.1 hypothetical protein LMG23994_00759 [Cupriavidus pinatubonensis]